MEMKMITLPDLERELNLTWTDNEEELLEQLAGQMAELLLDSLDQAELHDRRMQMQVQRGKSLQDAAVLVQMIQGEDTMDLLEVRPLQHLKRMLPKHHDANWVLMQVLQVMDEKLYRDLAMAPQNRHVQRLV